jgi:hypothetical protein
MRKILFALLPFCILATTSVVLLLQKDQLPYGIRSYMFSNNQQDRFNEDRLKYEYDLMKDPRTGKIPEGIFEQEYRLAQRLPIKHASNITGRLNSYIAAGPNNRGGRTRVVKYDLRYNGTSNKIILAGCVSGGILRSTDDGQTWTMVTPQDEIKNLTCLAQDPRPGIDPISGNPYRDTWYAGTGEFYGNSASGDGTAAVYFGNGMFKSTDNGVTWTPLSATRPGQLFAFDSEWDFIYNIKVNPANGDVYVSCDNQLKRSTDGGASFSTVFGDPYVDPLFGVNDVEIKNDGSKIFLAVSGYNQYGKSGIYESLTGDAGSWRKFGGSNNPASPAYVAGWRDSLTWGRVVLQLAPSNQNLLFCYYQNGFSIFNGFPAPEVDLFKCDMTNPTYVWTNLSANMPDFPDADLFLSDPVSPQFAYDMTIKIKPDDPNVIILAGTNLYRSTDGFTTAANTSWIGGYDNTLYNNGGIPSYSYNMYPGSHPDMHYIEFNPVNSAELLCANDGGIQRTTNILAPVITWNNLNNYQSLQYYYVSIDPGMGRMNFIGGSQDNGTSFRDATTDVLGPRPPYRPGINDHEELLGGDGGACALSQYNAGNQYAYVSAQYGDVYRIEMAQYNNPGANYGYTYITPDASFNYLSSFLTYFILDPYDTESLYLFGNEKLLRTTSASTVTPSSWTFMSGSSNFPTVIRSACLSKGVYNSTHALYFGTQDGRIFRLDDPKNCSPATIPVDISIPSVAGATVIGLCTNPLDDNELMAVLSNYNTVSIWITRNAKSASPTWVSREGNLSLPSIRCCQIVPVWDGIEIKNEYYVGTTIGLYSCVNIYDSASSVTWEREGDAVLGKAVIHSLDLRVSDNTLLVGTHGNGMYYTQIGTPVALPVTWLDFSGTIQNDDVLLKWTVAQQRDADKFIIQRKYADETSFNDIGEIRASANSNATIQYQFRDPSVRKVPLILYRLKQVDRGGQINYSKTISIKFQPSVVAFIEQVYPTVGNGIFNIRVSGMSGIDKMNIRLTDAAGRVVFNQPFNYQNQQINPGRLAAGIYLLEISTKTGLLYEQKLLIR